MSKCQGGTLCAIPIPGMSCRARLERRIPVGRIGTADEIGRLTVAVLTADCRFLTGETITIDGAQGRRL